MSRSFSFKQFTIHQDGAAMKLGIDSVLLGAWVNTKGCETLLDVGTGTGILALMLAQKTPNAKIHAIDIDLDALNCARENFENAPFANRLTLSHESFQSHDPNKIYQLIISNPPYFSNGIEPNIKSRRTARFDTHLSLSELFQHSFDHLAASGTLQIILPANREEESITLSRDYKLFLTRKCAIIPVRGREKNRILLSFGKEQKPLVMEEIVIREKDNSFTEEFKTLTSDFYTKL